MRSLQDIISDADQIAKACRKYKNGELPERLLLASLEVLALDLGELAKHAMQLREPLI